MARQFNFCRVKIHHSYTVSELAELLGAHRQTVQRWIAAKQLPTIDDRRLDDSFVPLSNVHSKQERNL